MGCEFPNTATTQLSTHAADLAEIVSAWSLLSHEVRAELAEIAAAWPGLSREIQTAMLTLVRGTSDNTR